MTEGTLKRYVNEVVFWNAFIEETSAEISMQHKRLEQAVEPVDVYRCQGAIEMLKRLQRMRDKYNG